MTLSRSLLISAFCCLVTFGCKKSGPEPTTTSKDDQVPAVDKAEAPPPTKDNGFPTPGTVTIEQAFAHMGNDAAHRLVIRAPKLVSSGLVEMGLSAIPRSLRYDEAVTKTGFDPVKRVTGALIYADGDLDKFETAAPVIILGANGEIDLKLIEVLADEDDDDDDDDDDDKEGTLFTFALLVNITPEAQAKLLGEMVKREEGKPDATTETIGNAVVVAKPTSKGLKYGYIWAGGLLLAEVPVSDKKDTAHAKELLKPILAMLVKAGAGKGSDTGPDIDGRGSMKGTSTAFTVQLGNSLVVKTKTTVEASKRARVEQIFGVINTQPEAFAGQMPPEGRALVKMVLDGTKIEVKDGVVETQSELDLAKLSALAKPLLEKVGKQ